MEIRNEWFIAAAETSNTFVGICPEQENTFKVLQQSFNSDLITRFCKCASPALPEHVVHGQPGLNCRLSVHS